MCHDGNVFTIATKRIGRSIADNSNWKICYKIGKSATILAIIFAVVFYLVGLIWAKILDKNDYYMLPYGEKIYNFLKRIKLVKPTND